MEMDAAVRAQESCFAVVIRQDLQQQGLSWASKEQFGSTGLAGHLKDLKQAVQGTIAYYNPPPNGPDYPAMDESVCRL